MKRLLGKEYISSERIVSLAEVEPKYSLVPPFDPSTRYPEYPFDNNDVAIPYTNPAYEGVRNVLRNLNLDIEHFSTPNWNPLGELVEPGNNVVIKPNLIRESHAKKKYEWIQVITHGSVIRAVIDYVFISLKGEGKVIVADGPQTDSDFDELAARNGLYEIADFYQKKGLNIELLDLRREKWLSKDGITYKRLALPGDPKGYVTVDLAEASEFSTYSLNGKFYGADYDVSETNKFHNHGKHEYVLCKTVMDADVLINLPKMKTHKKTGVTLSLKNMVGVNGYRNCLPHHTIGTPKENGDELPSSGIKSSIQSKFILWFKNLINASGGEAGNWARALKRLGALNFGETSEVVRSGNWHGNDTAWRMVLDLNKIIIGYDSDGERREKPLSYLTIVDGIIAGEGDGPLSPDSVPFGRIVAGLNPVAVDTVCATIMGFDYKKIPLLRNAWSMDKSPLVDYPVDELVCCMGGPDRKISIEQVSGECTQHFNPHFGWKDHIEKGPAD